MRHEKRCHAWLADSNAGAVAGHSGLGDFENHVADPVPVPDAHLVVGQSLDREVLAEKPGYQVVAVELLGPVAIRIELVHEDGAVLAAVSTDVTLTIAIDVEAAHHPWPIDG